MEGYTGVKNSTCSFCAEMCAPPDIDASIGFFDGFDQGTVGWTYAVLIVFSLAW
jgi:hypothetical protein